MRGENKIGAVLVDVDEQIDHNKLRQRESSIKIEGPGRGGEKHWKAGKEEGLVDVSIEFKFSEKDGGGLPRKATQQP